MGQPDMMTDRPLATVRIRRTASRPIQVLPVGAGREVWLAERRKGIGGSDALAVMGLSPYSSAYAVWADKLNLLPAKPETEAMLWGRLLEPVVADYFATTTGVAVRRAGMFHHGEHPWMRYNPDRLTADGGLLEVKTTSIYHADEWKDGQTPDAAEAQVRHGMAVLNRPHAWVIALIAGQKPVIRRITRDPEIEHSMFVVQRSFWFDHVLTCVPPDPDGSSSCARTLYQLHRQARDDLVVHLDEQDLAVLDEHAQLKQKTKQLDESRRELENWVKHRLGDAVTGLHDGAPVVTWPHRSRKGYTVAPTEYRQLINLRQGR